MWSVLEQSVRVDAHDEEQRLGLLLAFVVVWEPTGVVVSGPSVRSIASAIFVPADPMVVELATAAVMVREVPMSEVAGHALHASALYIGVTPSGCLSLQCSLLIPEEVLPLSCGRCVIISNSIDLRSV